MKIFHAHRASTGLYVCICVCEHSVPSPLSLKWHALPSLGSLSHPHPHVIHRPHAHVLSACPKSGCMTSQKFPFDFTDIGRTSFLASGVAKLCCHKEGTVCIRTSLCLSAVGREKSTEREVNKVNQTALGGFVWPEPTTPPPLPCLVIGIDTAPQRAQASWAWGPSQPYRTR